jgi:hypothetical protein
MRTMIIDNAIKATEYKKVVLRYDKKFGAEILRNFINIMILNLVEDVNLIEIELNYDVILKILIVNEKMFKFKERN